MQLQPVLAEILQNLALSFKSEGEQSLTSAHLKSSTQVWFVAHLRTLY